MKESADGLFNVFSPRYWLGQIDLRPLGFMRIVFGAVLFFSVIDLAPVLEVFFSDWGVAPRSALLGSLVRSNRFSVYDVAGPEWVLITLFVLTLVSIVIFTVGWHSRIASVTTFLLVCGIHERNLLVFDGSDNVIRCMLFWLMFMPTGARYSIDAVLRSAAGKPLVTHGTALPIRMGQLQIAWVYLNTTIHKWSGVEWHNGSALRIALGLDHLFTRTLGKWLYNVSFFTTLGTYATIAIEVSFLPLFFLPLGRPTRGPLATWPRWVFQPTYKALALAGGTALHLGIATLMSVGNFSYIMISSYFLLWEPEWIEGLVRGLRRLWGSGSTKVFYDGECAICTRGAAVLRGFDIYGNLQLINFRERGALAGVPGNLSKLSLDQRIHIVDADGSVRSGWSALTRLSRRVPALAPLGLLGSAPGLRQLGDPLYDKLAAHRQALAEPRSGKAVEATWLRLVPDWLTDSLRTLLYLALPTLMIFCMWFSFPEPAKIGGKAVIFGHAISVPQYDVSPSKMWQPMHDTIQELEVWQKWDMFSPKPLDTDMYLEGRGELTDGTKVDVVRGDGMRGPLPPDHPEFLFTRWTKYLNNVLTEGDNSPWNLEFGRYLCRHWNSNAPKGRALLKNFKLYKEYRKVPLVGETPVPWAEAMIWDHHCF